MGEFWPQLKLTFLNARRFAGVEHCPMFKEENVAVRGLSSSCTGSSWSTQDCGRFVFLPGSGKSNRFLAVNDVIVGSINHFPGKLHSKA